MAFVHDQTVGVCCKKQYMWKNLIPLILCSYEKLKTNFYFFIAGFACLFVCPSSILWMIFRMRSRKTKSVPSIALFRQMWLWSLQQHKGNLKGNTKASEERLGKARDTNSYVCVEKSSPQLDLQCKQLSKCWKAWSFFALTPVHMLQQMVAAIEWEL